MSIFKSNDIRGIFPRELSREKVYRIGAYLPLLLNTQEILVGRDTRLSSEDIMDALSAGITEAGADVIDIGLCDTPAVYFATNYYELRGRVRRLDIRKDYLKHLMAFHNSNGDVRCVVDCSNGAACAYIQDLL